MRSANKRFISKSAARQKPSQLSASLSPDDLSCLLETNYQSFVENLPVMFYAVEPEAPYKPIYISPAFSIFGYPLEKWRTEPDMWIRTLHPDDVEWVLERTRAAKEARESIDYEYRLTAENGEVFWVHDRSSFIYNEQGEPIRWQGIITDVTDSRAVQQSLIESEERYRNLFESAHDLVYIHDLNGKYVSVNQVSERIFGYTPEESLKMSLADIVVPEHLELASRMLTEKIAGARKTAYEVDCIAKNGSRLTLEINSTGIYKNGRLTAVQGIARDVTERKRAEKILQNSEAELRALFAAMPDVIVVLDSNGRYLKIAPTNAPPRYRTAEDLIGKTISDVFPRELAEELTGKIREALSLQKSVHIEYCITICQEKMWFAATISPMENDAVVWVARNVTERRQAEDALKTSEEQYRDLFENANDLIYTHDLNGNFTSLNRAGEIITGYAREEAVKKNIAAVVAPEFLEKARLMTSAKIMGDATTPYELEIISKSGQRVSLELSTRLIYRENVPVGVQGIGRNITERKRAEEALRLSERRYRFLSEGIMHQVWTARPNGKLDYVNCRTLEYFGRSIHELLDDGWKDMVHPDDLEPSLARWRESLETGKYYEVEFRLRRSDGVYRWYLARATAGLDADGKIINWFGTNTDINDKKSAEAKLNHFARHDVLTKLPNRAEFMNHLRAAIKQKSVDEKCRFAVLFLDLDRFKLINDSLGHAIGDKLLIGIATRLRACIRPGDTVARLGGDEFTILLNNTGDIEEVSEVAERLQQKLAKPFNFNNYEVFTSASIGITISDSVNHSQPEDYLRDADAAMYRAKVAGKARFEIFDQQMHVSNINLLQLETDLRHAVERKEFEVFYQPVVRLDTGKIQEFEALIRWRHPKRGLIAPNDFIETAEETGLIIPIGEWILVEACRQTAEWQRNFPAFSELPVSVNLSAKQLLYPLLTTKISETLMETGLEARHLKLEVTETSVMGNCDTSIGVLSALHALGVPLSTDDFGTGYSSLSYLHRFPFERLKIDRSFIGEMDQDSKSEAIVRTILMLGQNLNIETVAEGIETEKQLQQLRDLGCQFGQGYLFSPPVDALAAEELLRKNSSVASIEAPLPLPLGEYAENYIEVENLQ